MKRILIAFVLLLALAGAAMATGTTGTTNLTGSVDACSIGLTVPVDQVITLTRGSDNIQGLGNVQVISNCNTPWTLKVKADNANMYATLQTVQLSYSYLTTVMYIGTDGTTWTPFAPAHTSTGLHETQQITLATGNGAHTVPVYVKQPVTSSDAGGNYKIKFTFDLIQG